jgi:hypothetical protein
MKRNLSPVRREHTISPPVQNAFVNSNASPPARRRPFVTVVFAGLLAAVLSCSLAPSALMAAPSRDDAPSG